MAEWALPCVDRQVGHVLDRKSTRLNSSHSQISYAVFCLKKKKITPVEESRAARDVIATCAACVCTTHGPRWCSTGLRGRVERGSSLARRQDLRRVSDVVR